MGDNKKANGEVKITDQEFDDVFHILRGLQEKLLKYEEYQIQSYKWNLQHHTNIKKIMDSLNRISSAIHSKMGADNLVQIKPTEDDSLFITPKKAHRLDDLTHDNKEEGVEFLTRNDNIKEKGADFTSKSRNLFESKADIFEVPTGRMEKRMKVENFHDNVLRNRVNLMRLEELLSDISIDKFSELRETSAEILLPIAVVWLSGTEVERINIALAYLWETCSRFPKIFVKIDNRTAVKRAASAIGELPRKLTTRDEVPLTEDELAELKAFLTRSSAPLFS